MSTLSWLKKWSAQLGKFQSPSDMRKLHDWLWKSWRIDGNGIAEYINSEILHLKKDDRDNENRVRCDIPSLFAGKIEKAKILFVNINPSWDEKKNILENTIVSSSPNASWSFCESHFVRYPAEVGRMHWWNQAIGLGWRIMYGQPPYGQRADDKRKWALTHIAGWELMPIHAKRPGLLDEHPVVIADPKVP